MDQQLLFAQTIPPPFQNQNNDYAISNADKGAIFLAKRTLNGDIFIKTVLIIASTGWTINVKTA
jgi:hypothetical protein